MPTAAPKPFEVIALPPGAQGLDLASAQSGRPRYKWCKECHQFVEPVVVASDGGLYFVCQDCWLEEILQENRTLQDIPWSEAAGARKATNPAERFTLDWYCSYLPEEDAEDPECQNQGTEQCGACGGWFCESHVYKGTQLCDSCSGAIELGVAAGDDGPEDLEAYVEQE